MVAAAIAGSAVLGVAGSAISSNAAQSAAGQQASASEQATNTQQAMFNQTVANEQPYMNAGYGAQSQLNYLLGNGTPGSSGVAASSASGGYGSLNAPFTASMMQQYSPAYQFQLQQGQQGVLNQDATSQGAESGAALKDLTSFNQNYANTAFNNAFNQYQTQQSNTYSRLGGVAQLGQAAASNQATGASAFGNSIGQSISNVGTAQAGGTVGSANAISSGLSNAGQLGLLAALYSGGGTNPAMESTPNYSIQGADSSGLGYMVNG